MANVEHLALLQKGVAGWNLWREERRKENQYGGIDLGYADLTQADLTGADLRGVDLRHAVLGGANLHKADLSGAQMPESWLVEADLTDAKLCGANLRGAFLYHANLTKADLTKASLHEADLREADLTKADLIETHLHYARLVGTKLHGAKLINCSVYGISAWNLELNKYTKQSDLIITPHGQPKITVDDLNVAQFLYLITNNKEIRDVIDTVTSKVVLILGRFTSERKAVLDAVRDELRGHNYIPVMFDFEKPVNRSYRETISTLAHLARFVIADLTGAKVVLQELERIIPTLTSVPIQPILQMQARQNVVIGEDYSPYPWFLKTIHYRNADDVIASLPNKIVAALEAKRRELQGISVTPLGKN